MREQKRPNLHHEPLHPKDSETQTVGCRHTNADICSKNEMPHVCAFVRGDGMCLAPPKSWPRQYQKLLSGEPTPSKPVTLSRKRKT
jgi:hypothetical protein